MAEEKEQREVVKYTLETHICYHCGNKGIMEIKGEFENSGDEYWFFENYQLFKCPVCHKPIVFQEYISEDVFDVDDEGIQIPCKEIVFPSKKFNNSVPTVIRDAWESAIRIQGTDLNIYALALRRTLELIVKDKSAIGKDLQQKIEDLMNKSVLPDKLRNAADITRLIGNLGAHSTLTDNIGESEVKSIAKFVEYIIQYLYILPSEIEQLSKKTREIKNKE